MSKQTNPARTCADCLHCQACHLWSSGAISDSVATKCPQFKPARYASLAELQDLYRMYKGELVPVVHGRWVYGVTLNHEWRKCSECLVSQEIFGCFTYCPNCGAKMDGGEEK